MVVVVVVAFWLGEISLTGVNIYSFTCLLIHNDCYCVLFMV